MFVLDEATKKKFTSERKELEKAHLTQNEYLAFQKEGLELLINLYSHFEQDIVPICDKHPFVSMAIGQAVIGIMKNLDYAYALLANIKSPEYDNEQFALNREEMLTAVQIEISRRKSEKRPEERK